MGLVFEEAQKGCASVPLIIRYGHRYRVHRNVIYKLNLVKFNSKFAARVLLRAECNFWHGSLCFYLSWEAVVTAWQAGCESILTGRLVLQLVDAEENRTSCQPSGRHPIFALRFAVTLHLLRIRVQTFVYHVLTFAATWTLAFIFYTFMVNLLAIDLGG